MKQTAACDDACAKSLRFSFFDGIFANAMTGFTQDYFTPFLLLLGGSVRHVALLSALPNLAGSLIQLKIADFTEKLKSRRKIINAFVLAQAITLLPMAVIASCGRAHPFTFIVLVVVFTSCGTLVLPAWSSLMSDLVHVSKRGDYFGWRNKVLGLIIIAASFIAGFILQKMPGTNVFLGFVAIFASAFVFRMISWYFLTRMHEPYLEHRRENRFTLFDFLARARKSNFAQFVLFVSMMYFGVNVASPFFSVFMLKDLSFNYMLYTCITITATLTMYLVSRRWGRLSDRVGNLKVIKFTSPIIAILPLLWVINRSPVFLFFAQVVSGFAWAGFNLCASNFIYDAVTPGKRVRCIAYFNAFNGLAACCGATIGGFLVPRLTPFLGHRILTLFLIATVLRLAVAFIIPRRLKEVRTIESVSNYHLFLSMLGIRPLTRQK
ncbi:MAG: MFS transporter [Candidatus Omnitrophica bacterium]|nr:MFS transporter [Candidatus Omnitrophota bacterium]